MIVPTCLIASHDDDDDDDDDDCGCDSDDAAYHISKDMRQALASVAMLVLAEM